MDKNSYVGMQNVVATNVRIEVQPVIYKYDHTGYINIGAYDHLSMIIDSIRWHGRYLCS